jgi:glucoamylase
LQEGRQELPGAHIAPVAAGKRLRVTDPTRFRVVYTTDGWKTTLTKESRPVGYAGFFADIETAANQQGKVIFTLYWPGEDRWLGRNVEVEVLGGG